MITEGVAPNHKEAGIQALKAGIDVGISIEDAYMAGLIENVEEGRISINDVDRAVRRILKKYFSLGCLKIRILTLTARKK